MIQKATITIVSATALFCFLLAIACITEPVAAEPYIPQNDNTVLERLPSKNDAVSRNLKKLATEYRQNPENVELAVELSRRYMELSRTTGDPRYAGYAEAVLSNWSNSINAPLAILVSRAWIRQHHHDFEGALKDLDRALKRNPGNVQARLLRSEIFRVRAEYTEAARDCSSLTLLADPIVSAICQASISSLRGNLRRSYDSLSQLLEIQGNSIAPEIAEWAGTVLGEMSVATGDTTKAEEHFRQALQIRKSPDTYLICAYADLLLDLKRPDDALSLLGDQNLSDPILLRKALAAKASGSDKATSLIEQMSARFMTSAARGDNRHPREEARFELHLNNKPVQALKLATGNWNNQREPADARILLEAALSSGQFSAAAPVLSWAEQNRVENVRIASLIDRIKRVKK